MTRQQFMDGLKKNIDRVREYQLGMDGTGGKCDCIGLIIGAIRLAGGKWTGTHGSNYAARNEMHCLEKITSVSQLRMGDMVYKARMPGEENYSLPEKYRAGDDRIDYYHVGVVTSVQPLEIIHCTSVSGGIKRDNALGKWQFFGAWRDLDETTSPGVPCRVTGGRLKLREGPGTRSKVLAYLPDGAQVLAGETAGDGTWRSVSYMGQSGYAMACYLAEQEREEKQCIRRLLSLLQQAQQEAEKMLAHAET